MISLLIIKAIFQAEMSFWLQLLKCYDLLLLVLYYYKVNTSGYWFDKKSYLKTLHCTLGPFFNIYL